MVPGLGHHEEFLYTRVGYGCFSSFRLYITYQSLISEQNTNYWNTFFKKILFNIKLSRIQDLYHIIRNIKLSLIQEIDLPITL